MRNLLLLTIPLFLLLISCKRHAVNFEIPDYKNWAKPVNEVLDAPISGHGATFRIIFANDIAFKSKIVKGTTGSRVYMDDGSVVIKEVYEKREDIGVKTPGLFIMVKEMKNPEALNGWVYYMKKPNEEIVEIKGRMCIGCHVAANEKHPYFDGNKNEMFRDFLFVKIAK